MRATAVHHRGGFTITEMLFVLIAFSVFGLTAGRLFHQTILTSQRHAQAQDAAASFESAMTVLRADVFAAAKIESADGKNVRLDDVAWAISDAGLTRSQGGETRNWPVPAGMTFAVDGQVVVVRVAPGKDAAGGELRLINEPAVLAAMTQ